MNHTLYEIAIAAYLHPRPLRYGDETVDCPKDYPLLSDAWMAYRTGQELARAGLGAPLHIRRSRGHSMLVATGVTHYNGFIAKFQPKTGAFLGFTRA